MPGEDRRPFRVVQPWGPDRGRHTTLISEHASIAEAFAEIDRRSAEMVRTGARSDSVALIVLDPRDGCRVDLAHTDSERQSTRLKLGAPGARWRVKVPPRFITVCQNTAISKLDADSRWAVPPLQAPCFLPF